MPTGPRAGRADGSCTTTGGTANAPGWMICQVTLALQGGQLDIQTAVDSGPFFSGVAAPIAVVGGTGIYRDARREGTVVIPNPADPSSVVFTING